MREAKWAVSGWGPAMPGVDPRMAPIRLANLDGT